MRLSEVRTDYGLITFEGIGIGHKEIRGEIQRISVEYSLRPFAPKEIKLEKPDFKVTPETSASSDFGFNRTLAWLSSKVQGHDCKWKDRAENYVSSGKT